MATEYAKDQPEDFSNRIERVALIGVRLQLISAIVCMILTKLRLEVAWDSTLQSIYCKPENTR